MSSIRTAPEKKRIAYERDHYNRNGESNKAWRKTKPIKKAKARRAYRKAHKDMLHVTGTDADTASEGVIRRQNSIRQRSVNEWGAMYLRKFVETRRIRNQLDAAGEKRKK